MRWLAAALALGALAVAVVWAVDRLAPPRVGVPPAAAQAAADAASAAPASRPPAESGPSPPASRGDAALMLPAAAVPASAEQLQEETRAVALDLNSRYPNLPEALHVAAMMHSQLRQSEEAARLWKRCIELSPGYEGYYVNLAAIAMDRGDSELAVETLQQALAAGFSSLDISHHLGVSLTRLGRCDEAEEVLNKALSAWPDSAACWLVLGEAQLQRGQAAEAESSLRKALELGSQTPSLFFALGNACARQGKAEEAAGYRERFAEVKASEPLPAQRRYEILSTAEARRTAVTVLCEAATVHAWQGDSLESERLLLRAIALEPSIPVAYRALAGLYRAGGLVAEERAVSRRLVELEPDNLANYLDLSRLSAQLGDRAAAEGALKLAVTMQPGAGEPFAELGRYYGAAGRTNYARWYAQEAVRRDPTAANYRLLAATCRELGDEPTAAAALAKAGELEQGTKATAPAARSAAGE